MNVTLTKAVKNLETAVAFAEDGGVVTAIDRTTEALRLLEKEKRRRIKVGLLPKESK